MHRYLSKSLLLVPAVALLWSARRCRTPTATPRRLGRRASSRSRIRCRTPPRRSSAACGLPRIRRRQAPRTRPSCTRAPDSWSKGSFPAGDCRRPRKARWPRAVGGAQFRGRRSSRRHTQHPHRHPQRVVHHRAAGRRHRDDPHQRGDPARGAARDAGNAPAHERRGDGQGRQHLEDRAGDRGCARQSHAAARQFHASASTRLHRPDRAAALHERAPDGVGARAVRQGSHVGACRRHAQPPDPLGYGAGAAPPLRDDRHVRRQLDRRNVGRAVHPAKRRRQERDDRARQGARPCRQEPAGGDHAHHPHRAHERAADRHSSAGVPRGGQEMDRASGQGRRGRRRALLRLPGAEQPRRAHRPAASAGIHGKGSGAGARRARRRCRLEPRPAPSSTHPPSSRSPPCPSPISRPARSTSR